MITIEKNDCNLYIYLGIETLITVKN